jgi:hypothetical protein
VAHTVPAVHHWHRTDGFVFLETMMNKEGIAAVEKICESTERRINETLKDVIEQYDIGVAMSVLINVGTSMLAKAVILSGDDGPQVKAITEHIMEEKIKEARAAVFSLMAIHKAMDEMPPREKRH